MGAAVGWRRARLPELVIAVLLNENLLASDPNSIRVLADPGIVGGQMRIACIDPDRLACRLGDLLGNLGVLVALHWRRSGQAAAPRN